jgi:chromosome segregation ATPase
LRTKKAKAGQAAAEAKKAAEKEAEGNLRTALKDKREALDKAREAEKKLKAANETGGAAAQEAKAALERAQAQVRQLESDLKKAQEEGAVPEAVEEELTRLRQVAKTAPSAEIIRLREGYERLIQEMDRVLALLGEAAKADEAAGRKYAVAIRKALDKAAGRLSDMAGAA